MFGWCALSWWSWRGQPRSWVGAGQTIDGSDVQISLLRNFDGTKQRLEKILGRHDQRNLNYILLTKEYPPKMTRSFVSCTCIEEKKRGSMMTIPDGDWESESVRPVTLENISILFRENSRHYEWLWSVRVASPTYGEYAKLYRLRSWPESIFKTLWF